jgi:urease accessory protein
MGNGYTRPRAEGLRERQRPDEYRPTAARVAARIGQLQCWCRARTAWFHWADIGTGALLPRAGNTLAAMGGGASRLHRRLARGFLDLPTSGAALRWRLMRDRQPSAVRWIAVLLPVLLSAQIAFAHPQAGEAKGFLTGFRHPISGLDHVLAMVAVGLWGAQLGNPAIWLLPVAFPMVMAFGGMLGLMGVPLPGVEYGIAASAILLGAAVMFEVRPPLAVAALLVGFFAIFHGHAHGTELPPGESGLLYSIGFVIATGCLHAVGIGIGMVHRWGWGQRFLRFAGAIVAVGGVFFLWKAVP